MAKQAKDTYSISVYIQVETTVEVQAASPEAALEYANALKVTDVVEFSGDHLDSTIEVSGIYKVGSGVRR